MDFDEEEELVIKEEPLDDVEPSSLEVQNVKTEVNVKEEFFDVPPDAGGHTVLQQNQVFSGTSDLVTAVTVEVVKFEAVVPKQIVLKVTSGQKRQNSANPPTWRSSKPGNSRGRNRFKRPTLVKACRDILDKRKDELLTKEDQLQAITEGASTNATSDTTGQKKKLHTCAACGKSYPSLKDLTDHFDLVHMNIRPFECSKCDRRFHNDERLVTHFNEVHKRRYVCYCCNKKFKTKAKLRRHSEKCQD